MRRWMKTLAAALVTAAALWAVTLNGSLEVLGILRANIVDFSASTSTSPMKVGATLPAGCTVGQAFFKSDAAAGQNIYLCTAANTWTQVPGGGTFDWKPSPRYAVYRTDFYNLYNQGTPAYLGDWLLTRLTGSQNLNNPRGDGTVGTRPGMISISTTTTSGNRSLWEAIAMGPVGTNGESLYQRTDVPWEAVVIFRWPSAADYADSSTNVSMAAVGDSGTPAVGWGIRYIAGTDSAIMYFGSGYSGNWYTPVSTGVVPDTAWHKLRIRSDGTQQYRVLMQLDNAAEVSLCPSGCTFTVNSSAGVNANFHFDLTTNAAAQKLLQFDYVHFWMDTGAAR